MSIKVAPDIDTGELRDLYTRSPVYYHGFIFILARISNYDVWDVINCSFLNFNGAAVEVWEWISYLIKYFTLRVITYPGCN